jgi:predicted P-loop ATPase
MAPNVHPFPPQPEPWKARLMVDKQGAPRPIFFNAAHALRDAPAWLNVLAFDDFTKRTMLVSPPPWEMSPINWQPRPWTGQDDFQTTEWLQQQNILVPLSVAEHAVEMVAAERRYHPVCDYLNDLEWDGVPRLEGWMSKYLGATDDKYTSTVSRCTMIGSVARVSEPGCKVDNMPIFEGLQGIGKSSMAQALYEPWFSDEIADLGSKDAAMQMQGVWMIEIAELDAMSRTEVSKIKAFVSRRTDRFRPPYGRRVAEFPPVRVLGNDQFHRLSQRRNRWPSVLADQMHQARYCWIA